MNRLHFCESPKNLSFVWVVGPPEPLRLCFKNKTSPISLIYYALSYAKNRKKNNEPFLRFFIVIRPADKHSRIHWTTSRARVTKKIN